MLRNESMRATVVGAGVAGLTTALTLAARTALITLLRGGQRTGAIKGDETIQTEIGCLDALKRALDESYG